MLPYTPLHHLLYRDFGGAARDDERKPLRRADRLRGRRGAPRGSAGSPTHSSPTTGRSTAAARTRSSARSLPVRRSRGFAPRRCRSRPRRGRSSPPAPSSSPPSVSPRGDRAFLSPHLGDLDSEPAYRAFLHRSRALPRHARRRPEVVACDLHPEYLSTKWAHEQDTALIEVQHHHAHAAACLAEHREKGPALALVFDGTGLRHRRDALGRGAPALRSRFVRADRLARPDPAPRRRGGDPRALAGRRRSSRAGGSPVPWPRAGAIVRESLKANAPLSSGMGRLFDAVAAVLGVRDEVDLRGAGGDRAGAAGRRGSERSRTPGTSATRRLVTVTSRSRAGIRPGAPPPFTRRSPLRRGRACADAAGVNGRPLGRNLPEPAAARARPASGSSGSASASFSPARAAERRRDHYGQAAVAAQRVGVDVPRDPRTPSRDVQPASLQRRRSPASGARFPPRSSPRREVGDWVLVHVGFALHTIDEGEAAKTLALLEEIEW